MMKLCQFETGKLWRKRWLLLLTVSLLGINLFLLCIQYSTRETEAGQPEASVVSQAQYNTFLQQLQMQADNQNTISIFSAETSAFSQQNIAKTASDYEKMEGTKITEGDFRWVREMLEVPACNWLLYLFVFALTAGLVWEEREKGLFPLLRSCPRGGASLAISKLFLAAGSIFFFCLLLYGMNGAFFLLKGGEFSLTASVPSVEGFMGSTFQGSIGAFLLACMLLKSLGLLILTGFLLALAFLCPHIVFVLLTEFGAVGISFLLYQTIPVTSKWNFFRTLNCYGALQTQELLGGYQNLNFFKTPQGARQLVLTFGAFLLAAAVFSCLAAYHRGGRVICSRSMAFPEKLQSFLKKYHRLLGNHNGLFRHEGYKILRMNHGLALLLVFILLVIGIVAKENIYLSTGEQSIQQAMKEYEGILTHKKEAQLLRQKVYYDELNAQLSIIEARFQSKEITYPEYTLLSDPIIKQMGGYDVFQTLYSKYEYLKFHPNCIFVYEKGYYKLLGTLGDDNWREFLIMMLFLILLLGPVFGMEKNGMIRLLSATPSGRSRLSRYKVGWSLLLTLGMYTFYTLCRIYAAQKAYGFSCLWAPMDSLELFYGRALPGFSILGYLLLQAGIQLLVLLIIMSVILLLSRYCKGTLTAILINMVLLVLPMIIAKLCFAGI